MPAASVGPVDDVNSNLTGKNGISPRSSFVSHVKYSIQSCASRTLRLTSRISSVNDQFSADSTPIGSALANNPIAPCSSSYFLPSSTLPITISDRSEEHTSELQSQSKL